MRPGQRHMAVPVRLWWALLACVLVAAFGLVLCGATLAYLSNVLDAQQATIEQNAELIRQLERPAAEPAAAVGVSAPAAGRS